MKSDLRVTTVMGVEIEYLVRRHPKARHMRLQVNPFDGVVVTLPLRLPRYINPDTFVQENGEWVIARLKETGRMIYRSGTNKIRSGYAFMFRGKPHRLIVERLSVSTPHVYLNPEAKVISIYLPRSSEYGAADVLKEWLRSEARTRITEIVQDESKRIGVQYAQIAIRGQKTKWGSCSFDGKLTFNWRLVLFPPRVMRYVIIHELCHLRHFDHSLQFWKMVRRYMPEYRFAVDWLKREGMNARNLLVDL